MHQPVSCCVGCIQWLCVSLCCTGLGVSFRPRIELVCPSRSHFAFSIRVRSPMTRLVFKLEIKEKHPQRMYARTRPTLRYAHKPAMLVLLFSVRAMAAYVFNFVYLFSNMARAHAFVRIRNATRRN